MPDSPAFDTTLKEALQGLDNEDVRLFYAYFDDLQKRARSRLSQRARRMPGSSAVVQSALLSMFCDLSLRDIPLSETDQYGYPMLWPLLLTYLERHCDKWNKWYKAKKRQGVEVPLPDCGLEAGSSDNDFGLFLEDLEARLSEEERAVLAGCLQNQTLKEIGQAIGRPESTVANRLKRIRNILSSAYQQPGGSSS